jgi:hypothetical protein
MKTQKVLGMNLAELSLRDICEEITDCKRDVAVIEDYEKGFLTYGELTRETMFHPSAKQSLLDAILKLKEVKSQKQLVA